MILNVAGATAPGFQVLLNPLLALAAVSLAEAGPAPHIYLVPICSRCRPFNVTETVLGSVAAGNGCVAIAFASADYAGEFLRANENLVFANGEGLSDFKAKENLKAAHETRARRHKPAGWKINEARLLEILSDFEPVKAFAAKPNIPANKLSTAIGKCEVPATEEVVGLLDLRMFGSAKRAILFGREGIYCKGLGRAQRFSYNEFPSCVFTQAKGSPAISAGEKGTIPFGSHASQYPLLRVLQRIKREVELS